MSFSDGSFEFGLKFDSIIYQSITQSVIIFNDELTDCN